MARKARVEVAGGLYHVITRGNNRQRIFDNPADFEKFLSLLTNQKTKRPFFLYAYCLMTNHVHLLIERQADTVGSIMHRLLTGYSQYYNRRHQRVGHLLQGRHKAILCQSDRYLIELVRYIHLNPVRAKMVAKPEEYEYSGHRAYLGLAPALIMDVDPVLRHFGVSKNQARQRYRQFVSAGMKDGHQDEFYHADEGRILGSEEFVDATIHRIGQSKRAKKNACLVETTSSVNLEMLLETVERICGISRTKFCGSGKSLAAVTAKEMLVLIGREMGASLRMLSEVMEISSSSVSRRHESAKIRLQQNDELSRLAARIRNQSSMNPRKNRKSQA